MARLDGKVAIVTGAGRGIGRAHALTLAKAGAAVVVNDVGREFSGDGEQSLGPAEQVVSEIVAAGGKAIADGTDVSDWDAVGKVVDKAVETFGRLDIVVNNAGIVQFGSIDTISHHDWARTIATNLIGTAAFCHWATKHWREIGPEPGRRIINTSSSVGLMPVPGAPPMYAAAKAGVAALTITTATELAELGVRVNAIAPAARTRISQHALKSDLEPEENGFDVMSPEHVAALVLYLASSECRFTGRVVGIIGDHITLFDGWTITADALNNERAWTQDDLVTALGKFPLQQAASGQGLSKLEPHLTPAQATLDQLTQIEQGAPGR